ncbi:MAG: hypothetical protein ACR2OX_13005 [Methyloligellaceae bacterium]
MSPHLVSVAIGGSGPNRSATFAGVVRAGRPIDPLTGFEAMTQSNEKAGQALPSHGQAHQTAQPLRPPGVAGLVIKRLVRFALLRAPYPLARAADALVNAVGEKCPAAFQARP